MHDGNRRRLAVPLRWTWLPLALLAGGLIAGGCGDDDPAEPQPGPEPDFSAIFADGDFKAAFQIPGGGYVAAGTGSDGQAFIYETDPDGTETARYVFAQNAGAERLEDALAVEGGGYVVCGAADGQGWMARIDGALQTVANSLYQGGGQEDHFSVIAARADGGIVMGGECDWEWNWSTGDGWLVRATSNGVYQSQSVFGGSARDYVNAIVPDGDAGFFFGGSTFPTPSSAGHAWICKINAAADALLWNRSYLHDLSTGISGLVATPDGGCIGVGGTMRMETEGYGASDAYMLKVDADGDRLWSHTSGIDGADWYYEIVRAHDGGYVCAGAREGAVEGARDGWLVKVDDNGNTVWERIFAGGTLYSVECTAGDGYVCSGKKDGKAWLLKVDVDGESGG